MKYDKNLYHVYFYKNGKRMMKEVLGLSVDHKKDYSESYQDIVDYLAAFPSYGSEGYDYLDIKYARPCRQDEL